MEEILSAQQVKAWDAFTIKKQAIAASVLMERAGQAFVRLFRARIGTMRPVHIFAGVGNNGGDGLVVARLLHALGYEVRVYVVGDLSRASPDFIVQWSRSEGAPYPIACVTPTHSFSFSSREVLVDALFGTGLSRPLRGRVAALVHRLNASPALRVSIDRPSGLLAEAASSAGTVFSADWVICFQSPPLSFFMPENTPFVKEWSAVDIGLDGAYLATINTPYRRITVRLVANFLPVRPLSFHKGMAGRGLLIAGCKQMMGAAILSGRASLCSGLGLLTMHVPRGCDAVVQAVLPEAIVHEDEHPHFFTHSALDPNSADALAIGPGLGQNFPTAAALRSLLQRAKKPMVLDADALNLLSVYREMLHEVPKNSILTPHPGEFSRLVGHWHNDFERLENQRAFSSRYQVITLLKGVYTAVTMPDGRVWFNTTGNPGMSTAGTGDVLTGIILGLLAQGIPPEKAVLLAVWLHGQAGDVVRETRGIYALVASDLINYLPSAFRELVDERDRKLSFGRG